jgi:polysaccharide pyruvyl transferase WcaK-like protein
MPKPSNLERLLYVFKGTSTMSMDLALEAWVAGVIEWSKLKYMVTSGERWHPGRKLKLLFAGYNGTRNTGSDVRVEEMIRQLRHVIGANRCEMSVLSQDFKLTEGYFKGSRQVLLPQIFPPMLAREIPQFDGVVACEGSMFKSKFANALTTMMTGSLGIAGAQNKLSIAYGSEAGYMDSHLAKLVARYCQNSLIITRNIESQEVLGNLGVSTQLGADTAWTFEPLPPSYGESELRRNGWDGVTPVLVVCPVNPFFWPVRASVAKFIKHKLTGAHANSHYRSVYFHEEGPEVDRKFETYLTAIANTVKRFQQEKKVFFVLAATEQLDTEACQKINAKLGGGVPIFSSANYDMYQLVSILRSCHLMVASRFHGIVTCMEAGVASAGVTIDERIRNLMRERDQQDLMLEADEPDLEEKLVAIMRKLQQDQEAIRDGIFRTVTRNLKVMAKMGIYFEEELQRRYPEFPIRQGVRSWEEYLPPLSTNLRKLLEAYD